MSTNEFLWNKLQFCFQNCAENEKKVQLFKNEIICFPLKQAIYRIIFLFFLFFLEDCSWIVVSKVATTTLPSSLNH